jgi:prepilin-type N-terminal cleavage/methylation domain-containing protein
MSIETSESGEAAAGAGRGARGAEWRRSRCPVMRLWRSLDVRERGRVRASVRAGFTIIELLVVIVVIALIVSIMLPAMSNAKKVARQSRELSTARQLMVAYSAYANDYNGNVMPGYASAAMAAKLRLVDQSGQPIQQQVVRRYPWRILSYLGFQFEGMYDDETVLSRYRGQSNFTYVVSLSPSLGVNADFVGGKSDPGYAFNANALRQWGRWYVTRIDEVRRTSQLIAFASARGYDDNNLVVPGFHMVDAPAFTTQRWSDSAWQGDTMPEDFGHVDLRWSANGLPRAVTAHLDGHAQTLGLAELRDMRWWANRAETPDYVVGATGK